LRRSGLGMIDGGGRFEDACKHGAIDPRRGADEPRCSGHTDNLIRAPNTLASARLLLFRRYLGGLLDRLEEGEEGEERRHRRSRLRYRRLRMAAALR